MPVWKFVIGEPDTRKTYQLEIDQSKAIGLIGKKIGEEFNGEIIGLPGYTLKITGGTDKDGFPMHPSVNGTGRRKILLSGPPCFHPKLEGQRKRKMVHGNMISEDIVQINVKVIKKGEKPLEELLPTKPKKEAKKEEKVEEKKKEVKPEEEKKPEAKPQEEEKEKSEEKEKVEPEKKKAEGKLKEEKSEEKKESKTEENKAVEEKKTGGEEVKENKP